MALFRLVFCPVLFKNRACMGLSGLALGQSQGLLGRWSL